MLIHNWSFDPPEPQSRLVSDLDDCPIAGQQRCGGGFRSNGDGRRGSNQRDVHAAEWVGVCGGHDERFLCSHRRETEPRPPLSVTVTPPAPPPPPPPKLTATKFMAYGRPRKGRRAAAPRTFSSGWSRSSTRIR